MILIGPSYSRMSQDIFTHWICCRFHSTVSPWDYVVLRVGVVKPPGCEERDGCGRLTAVRGGHPTQLQFRTEFSFILNVTIQVVGVYLGRQPVSPNSGGGNSIDPEGPCDRFDPVLTWLPPLARTSAEEASYLTELFQQCRACFRHSKPQRRQPQRGCQPYCRSPHSANTSSRRRSTSRTEALPAVKRQLQFHRASPEQLPARFVFLEHYLLSSFLRGLASMRLPRQLYCWRQTAVAAACCCSSSTACFPVLLSAVSASMPDAALTAQPPAAVTAS